MGAASFDARLVTRMQTLSRLAAAITIIAGCVVMVGWVRNIEALKTGLSGLVAMKFNTALAFTLSGIGLLTLSRKPRIAQVAALIVAALGLLTAFQYLFGWNLNIDQFFVREVSGAVGTLHPGRMSFITAVNFSLLGSALILITRSSRYRTAHVLTLIAGSSSLLVLIGYIDNVEELYRLVGSTSTALSTAAAFIIFCLGILTAYPDKGVATLYSSTTVGGYTARRLLPVVVFIPIIVGWLRLQGELHGLYDSAFGVALFTLAYIFIFAGIMLAIVYVLHNIDLQRHFVLDTLQQANQHLEVRVQERTSELTESNHLLAAEIVNGREAEEQFRALLEAAPDAIIIVNEVGQIIMSNMQTERLFGYKYTELAGQSIEILIPEHLRNGHESHRDDYNETPETRGMGAGLELYALRKDGSQFAVEISLSPVKTEKGLLVFSAIRDITERKQAEEALIKSEALLGEMGRVAHVGGWEFRVDTTELVWTEAVNLIHEVDPTYKPTVDNGIEFYASASKPIIDQAIKRAIEYGEAYNLDLEIVTAKGNHRWVHTIGKAHQEHGKTKTVTGMIQDITERKQAEQTLARYSERLAMINRLDRTISSNLDLSQIYDTFVKELQGLVPLDRTAIVRLNETGDQWQITRQWTQHQPAIFPGEWRPIKGSVIEWLVINRVPYSEPEIGVDEQWPETTLLQHEGIRSRLLIPLVIREQVVGVLTVASRQPSAFSEEDQSVLIPIAHQLSIAIQNSTLYEQVQLHAAELEQRVAERTTRLTMVNKELESFSYSVSHDLRSPLRAMDGYSQALLEDYADRLDDEGKYYLERVRAATQRMGNLIDDLLQLSRLTRGEMQVSMVNLSTLACEIIEEFQRSQPERAVEIVIEPGLVAEGDMRLLRVVLENLLNNAWKFTSMEDHAQIEFGQCQRDGHSTYFVRDNGAGFDMSYAGKLFGAFQRLHSTDEFEGNGIGLATVQRIIHRHGGQVSAEGVEGQGATFYFTLKN